MGKASDFTINGTLQSTLGYDATHGETLTLALESAPAIDVWKVEFRVIIASKNAPTLVVSPDPMTRFEPPWQAEITAPDSGAHTYQIACVVNGGVDSAGRYRPDYTSERIFCIRSDAGLRKWLPAESTQYSARGWSDEQNDAVDAGGSPSTPSAIVVDVAALAQTLPVDYVVAENTITGTGVIPWTAGTTVLIVATPRPGFASEAGWYEVGVSVGATWTLTRMPGTEAGTVMPAGQVTLVRVPAPSWSEWTQDLPIFPANGVGVHEWVLPNAATMGSAVSDEQAVFAPAVDVSREVPEHEHDLATVETPGFMSPEQVGNLEWLVATDCLSGSNVVVVDKFSEDLPAYTASPLTLESSASEALVGATVGQTVLFAGETPSADFGWYVATRVDAPWLLTRLPGLDTTDNIRDRTVTLFADASGEGAMGVILVDSQWPGGTVGTTTLSFEKWNEAGDLPFGSAPPAVAATSSAGVATTVSRSDHTHAHGAQGWGAGAGLAHPEATATDPGFMSTEQYIALSELSATRPIVVYTSIPSSALVDLAVEDENTISGTGPFAPVGVTALVVAPYETGVANLSGWYVVTVSTGSVWIAERMEGLRAGDTVPEGQLTVCRMVSPGLPPVTCWVMSGGTTVGAMSDKLTPLPAVGMPFGGAPPAVAAASSAGVATTVARSDHTHEGALLSDASPLAVGTASAGVALTASRADHVHAPVSTPHRELSAQSTTTDATATTILTYTTASNERTQIVVTVAALKAADGSAAIFRKRATFKTISGTVTQIGVTAEIGSDTDVGASAWIVAIDTSSGDIRVRVTGSASTTIKWEAFAVVTPSVY